MSASRKANEYASSVRPATMRDVAAYIYARHSAYLHKHGLGPRPTDAPMCGYSFTNLNRSLDSGTIALQRVYDSVSEADLGFVVAVGRVINQSEIMWEYLPHLLPYRADAWINVVSRRKLRNDTVRGNAYLMTTHARAEPFEEFYGRRVFPLWWGAKEQFLSPHDSLSSYAEWLRRQYGVGPFLCGQIVADLKPRLKWMQSAPDRDSWFVLGPGSKRALRILRAGPDVVLRVRDLANYILGCELDAHYRVDAQDAQNTLCEFDKYWRIKTGYGYRRKRVLTPITVSTHG